MTVGKQWFRCRIDRKELKHLSHRSDRQGLMWFGGYLAVLGITGFFAHLSLATYWAIPTFFAYGTVWCFSNAIGHELSHGTPFRTRWLNEMAFLFVGILNVDEPIAGRRLHMKHHSYTSMPAKDPELVVPSPMSWREYLSELSGMPMLYAYSKWIIQHSLGIVSDEISGFVPSSEYRKMFWNARIILSFYIGVIVWASVAQTWYPVLMFILPRFIGAPVMASFFLTQHAGLALDVWDHRRSTRTIYMNPVFRFLYWNMNYHVEHHMFPMVPFYALPKLHERVKTEMPPANTSLFDAYKEILSAIRKQHRDPSYVIPRNASGYEQGWQRA